MLIIIAGWKLRFCILRSSRWYVEYTLSCMWPDGPKGRSGEAIHRNFYKYTGILRIEIFRASLVVSVQSVQLLSPSLCDPMNCSTPGLPVLHHLPEHAQTHARWVSDAIQPSHPLSSPSPPAFSLSQHQGVFKWVSSSHQLAKVEFQLQHQSF